MLPCTLSAYVSRSRNVAPARATCRASGKMVASRPPIGSIARAAARRMPDGGGIVFNASISGLAAEPGFADYSASKGGQVLLARTFAKELGPRGFWVTVVCPGYVRTPMVDRYLDDPEVGPSIVRHIPIGRVGNAEEVASLVSYLASPEAAYMNGSVVTIDGGRLA